jgi:hypothetical protein
MRRFVPLLLLSTVACAGPHSTGALWSLQNLEHERAYFAASDAERQARAQEYELSLADETLASERQRLQSVMQTCPGPREPLASSSADAARDQVRLRADADADRLAQVAQLAQADWYVRRAAATGDARFCQRAQDALTNTLPPPQADRDLLAGLRAATVTRDPRQPTPELSHEPAMVSLSNYALGVTDSVTAAAPLPQYLALVYGGMLQPPQDPALDQESAAASVDRAAPAFPEWEPDALYAALRGGRP